MSLEVKRGIVLQVSTADNENRLMSFSHNRTPRKDVDGVGGRSASFSAQNVVVTQFPSRVPGDDYELTVSRFGKGISGQDKLRAAQSHDLSINIYGISLEDVRLSSDLIDDTESLLYEASVFETRDGNDFNRRILVPLAAGQLVVNLRTGNPSQRLMTS